MFLHLGNNETIPREEILAIIEIEKNKVQRSLAGEYSRQGKQVTEIVPLSRAKSLIISPERIYFSPISSKTLARRIEALIDRGDDEDDKDEADEDSYQG